MNRTPYGFTHNELCIEDGHCYHHIDRLDLMVCCVCQLFRACDDRENDCGS